MSAPISLDAHNRARQRESLGERRARRKRRLRLLYILLLTVILASALWGIWQPQVRIQHVTASGEKKSEIEGLTTSTLAGTYGFILPRDSFFFVSEGAIRNTILDTYPDLSAVSVSRTGFTSLGISVVPRVASFRWCGASVASSTSCYLSDAEGLVFKELNAESASSTKILLGLYAPLAEKAASSSPLRAHVVDANKVPSALRFINAIAGLGAPVDRLQLRGDEADVYVKGTNTRITYVLGHEEEAATLAGITLPKLNLTNGSIDYVDLRFPGKAYFKKK